MGNASIASQSRVRVAPVSPFQFWTSSVPAKQTMRTVLSALSVGIAYYVGTRIGFALTPNGQPNSAFWPPNAILLAALLLAPREIWWTFLIAVLPAHMFAQLQTGVPVWTAVGWFITNTSEALIGAFCITRFTDRKTMFDSVRGVFVFLVFGVLLAPLATSFLDASAVVITGWGRGYWPLSTQRFWTNALAELTVVPAIVLCVSKGVSWIRKASSARWWEAGLLVVGSVLVSILVFGVHPVSLVTTPALLYAPLPLLLWATVRFGAGGLSLSVLCVGLISISYTIHGRLPFPYTSMQENILSLQILFCIVVVPLMFLSAVIADARRTQASLRNISGRLINAQEEERHRIARELHDDLGQELALAQVSVSELMENSSESLKRALADVLDQLSSIATTAREISHGLYPKHLEYLGLVTAIKKLCDEMGRGKQVSIHLTMGGLRPELPQSISLCLYRVLQEGLHNVLKHSDANNVYVVLNADKRQISLQVVDDGTGFDPTHEISGLGFHSMRERVRSVGGSIDIVSSPEAGTRIDVRVPLAEDETSDSLGAGAV